MHAFWNGIIAAHAASQVRATKAVTPDTYRGWSIKEGRWPEPAFMATGPNYDAWTDGEGDWTDNGEKAEGKTLLECLAGVDAWIEENEHA